MQILTVIIILSDIAQADCSMSMHTFREPKDMEDLNIYVHPCRFEFSSDEADGQQHVSINYLEIIDETYDEYIYDLTNDYGYDFTWTLEAVGP